MSDLALDTRQTGAQDALSRLMDLLEGESEDRRRIDMMTFMIDHVCPAVMRAMTTGTAGVVDAPDHETARLLRLALAETALNRPTDRLLTVTATREDATRAAAQGGAQGGAR